MRSKIDEIYGNKVRIRVSGLCWNEDHLLVVNHSGLSHEKFWAPPGGGIDFGITAEEALITEFLEETGLEVQIGTFQFVCEYIEHPLHAVELFFQVKLMGGTLKVGFDPEMQPDEQIIRDVEFYPYSSIQKLKRHEKHGIFTLYPDEKSLKNASGYIKI